MDKELIIAIRKGMDECLFMGENAADCHAILQTKLLVEIADCLHQIMESALPRQRKK